MDEGIKSFIRSASVEELKRYKQLLQDEGGNIELIELISFILDRVDKLS